MKHMNTPCKEKDSKNPAAETQHIKERARIEGRLRSCNKRKRGELKGKLEGQIQEWSRGETEKDEITANINAKKVLSIKGEKQ